MARKKRKKTASTPEEQLPEQDGVNGDFNAWMQQLKLVVNNLPGLQVQALQKAGTVHDLNSRREKGGSVNEMREQPLELDELENLSHLTKALAYLLPYIFGRFGEETVVNDFTDHMYPRDQYIDMLEASDDERN